MSNQLEIVAILHPKPGKADRVLELLTGVAKIVKEKEPGTLKYHLLKETRGGSPRVIVSETYKDSEALKKHGAFPEFKQSNKALMKEDLLAGKTQIIVLSSAAGFASRL